MLTPITWPVPGHPAAAVDWALDGNPATVLDLGAGIGILTAALAARGLRSGRRAEPQVVRADAAAEHRQ